MLVVMRAVQDAPERSVTPSRCGIAAVSMRRSTRLTRVEPRLVTVGAMVSTDAAKGEPDEGVARDLRGLADVDLADVHLVHLDLREHVAEVFHPDQRRVGRHHVADGGLDLGDGARGGRQ